ncbi:hypothetical protein QE364_004039 [Nocardioides zeae]|uniref:Uncharacterized protein n=1 Tax=Nocardioides zeae TaxID=1457234 RepID=A0ACC6INR7_9ACTN|nr:hypothetical protein [Nocardioides zeae]MDR6175108.1 hypothetical protein [Nocardioides zeae]MDR6212303.1 hypothetical protein [Nocardioides zeae]
MSERDWSSFEPEPQDVGTFARAVAATPSEGWWDDYAMVEDVPAYAAPEGWIVPLVEARTSDAEEAIAFADLAEAALRDDLGAPAVRDSVHGYTDAGWIDAVAVALGAGQVLVWSLDGAAVALLRVAVGDTLDVWLVTAQGAAASATLPALLPPERDGAPTFDELPDELARTFRWLVRRGLAVGVEPGGSLEGWFPPGTDPAAVARLTPLVRLDGTGSVGALWRDDEGRDLVVALGSEGGRFVVADSVLDLVRLMAVGYEELDRPSGPPVTPFGVLRAAELRAWVEETFGVDVPRAWVSGGPDEFSAWMDGVLGEDTTPAEPPAGMPEGAIGGDVDVLLDALGTSDAVERIAYLLALPAETSQRDLALSGVEVDLGRAGARTIWVKLKQYPRAQQLLDGIDLDADADAVVAAWGTPEGADTEEGSWVRYVVGGRYLHLQFGYSGISLVTLMTDAP